MDRGHTSHSVLRNNYCYSDLYNPTIGRTTAELYAVLLHYGNTFQFRPNVPVIYVLAEHVRGWRGMERGSPYHLDFLIHGNTCN